VATYKLNARNVHGESNANLKLNFDGEFSIDQLVAWPIENDAVNLATHTQITNKIVQLVLRECYRGACSLFEKFTLELCGMVLQLGIPNSSSILVFYFNCATRFKGYVINWRDDEHAVRRKFFRANLKK